MPIHNGLLPREGFTADLVFKLLGRTAFNPILLLPVYLLAKFTKKGEDFTMLHPTAFSRFKKVFYLALVRYLSKKLSDGVTNGWSNDRYNWPEEIAVITGGSGGIGGHVVKLLAERGLKVVVLDIQPMTYDAGEQSSSDINEQIELTHNQLQGPKSTTSTATLPQLRASQRWPRKSALSSASLRSL